MKVWLVVVYEPIPDLDGDARSLRYGALAQTLAGDGHDVTLWTSNYNHVRKRHRFEEPPPSIKVGPHFRVRLLPARGYRRNVSIDRIRHNLSVARAFEQRANQCSVKPDVVFACLPILELAEKAVQYARAKHIPVIVDVLDEWPDLYLTVFPQGLRSLARVALIPEFRRARRILQAATGITAVSSTYLQWALGYATRPRQDTDAVFPLGYARPDVGAEFDSERWVARLQSDYGIRPDSLVVTFVGQFGASYDLETVVEAARRLQAEGEARVQFVLAGDGDKRSKLREMAHTLPNVVFTGWLDQSAMIALLRLSSVGLAAYGDQALQSLPYKPFEYMAAGLPILSSLRGELETLICDEQIGIRYQSGNAGSLVEGIYQLLTQVEARKRMGINAQKLFEKRFSAEVIYPQLVEHLKKIAGK